MYSSRNVGLAIAAIVLAAGSIAGAAEPGSFGYGRVATPAQIAGWDIDVRGEDGAGLPPGNGVYELRQQGIVASATPYQKSYLRLGPSIVTTPEQVDAAVEAVAGLV